MHGMSRISVYVLLLCSCFRVQDCRAADWPKYKGDLLNSGFNIQEQTLMPPLKMVWSWTESPSVAIESSPVIYGDKVFIGTIGCSNGAAVVCFDADTGRELWNYRLGDIDAAAVYPTPLVSSNRVYVPSWDGCLYCFDVNGPVGIPPGPLWKTPLADAGRRVFRSSPVIRADTNMLFLATEGEDSASRLIAVETQNGNKTEEFDFPPGYGAYSSLALCDDRVIVGLYAQNTNGMIICMDVSNPLSITQKWSYVFKPDEPALSSPVVENGIAYYVVSSSTGTSTTLYCFDVDNGSVLSTQCIAECAGWTFGTPSIAYGNIYLTTLTKLFCLNLALILDNNPQTDSLVWQYELPEYNLCWFVGSSPCVANGTVYFEAGDMDGGTFLGVDARTGEEQFRFRGPEGHEDSGVGYCISSPAVARGKVVFVSAHDYSWSGLYCFESNLELDADGDGMPDNWEKWFFGSVTNADASTDWDKDGSIDVHEYFGGTVPTNAASLLAIFEAKPGHASELVIGYYCVSNRSYSIERSTNLPTASWETITSNIPGIPPSNTHTVNVDIADSCFFRVRSHQQP